LIALDENNHVEHNHVQVQKHNLSNDSLRLFLFDANLMAMNVIDMDKMVQVFEMVESEMELVVVVRLLSLMVKLKD
jgi:hypothetical protein